MGNWRTVNVIGTIARQSEVDALREHLDYGNPAYENGDYSHFGPLSFNTTRPGLCGLGDWPALQIARCGNLAERDYSVKDVAETLRELVRIAPTMLLKVHCGGDWESDECVATISVGEGLVAIGKPEVETIDGAPEEQMLSNFMQNLCRTR